MFADKHESETTRGELSIGEALLYGANNLTQVLLQSLQPHTLFLAPVSQAKTTLQAAVVQYQQRIEAEKASLKLFYLQYLLELFDLYELKEGRPRMIPENKKPHFAEDYKEQMRHLIMVELGKLEEALQEISSEITIHVQQLQAQQSVAQKEFNQQVNSITHNFMQNILRGMLAKKKQARAASPQPTVQQPSGSAQPATVTTSAIPTSSMQATNVDTDDKIEAWLEAMDFNSMHQSALSSSKPNFLSMCHENSALAEECEIYCSELGLIAMPDDTADIRAAQSYTQRLMVQMLYTLFDQNPFGLEQDSTAFMQVVRDSGQGMIFVSDMNYAIDSHRQCQMQLLSDFNMATQPLFSRSIEVYDCYNGQAEDALAKFNITSKVRRPIAGNCLLPSELHSLGVDVHRQRPVGVLHDL